MRELHLGDGAIEVVVLPEAGARLHRLRAFGQDLLRTPSDAAEHLRDPFFWGAYVMGPWCNRISAQATSVAGRTVGVASNFADGTAIHGQVYAMPWSEMGDGSLRVDGGGAGWPWAYQAALGVAVAGATVAIGCSLMNRSPEPMPAGIGLHPWWRRPLQLALDARLVYPSNVAPPAKPVAPSGPLDLRTMAAPIDGMDATWTDLGPSPLELAWPELGIHATLRGSATASHVAVATPRGPNAVAVEFQTHAPDGLQRLLLGLPGGMTMLAPGEELRLDLEMEIGRA